MPQLSEWKDTTHFQPAFPGWYEVNHPKEGWCSGNNVYARWNGVKWERALGWIAAGNEKAWTIGKDGKLIVAWPLNVFQDVAPTEYRGFVAQETTSC